MSLQTACPDRVGLQALIDATLPEADAAEITSHVDTCEHCQHALEELTGDESVLPGASRSRVIDSEVMDTTLRRAVRQLKSETELADSGADEAEPAATDDLSLDFLDPPDKPDCLGRLSHYEVTEVIGRGGMGVVLKAFDPSLNRFVAIKVLAPQLATSAAGRKRFAREAQAAAAVSHEHVVAIHGVDEVRGLPYIVMAYVPGRSLQERIDQAGPLELVPILRIGMQTAAGLAAAHAQGLIHRDVKPANILLEDDVDRVKITDFGLARAADDASLTQSGMVAGTPEYMSPEQAGGHAVDHRSDLFSLGSVLYSMCTGRPPFRAESAVAVLRRVCDHEPHPIHELNPAIPDWLAAIIAKLHSKQPVDRFQSVGEVSDLLGQCLAHVQQPRTAPLPRPAKELAREQARRRRSPTLRRRLTVAAASVLFLFGGLGLTEATGVTHLGEFVGQIVRVVTPRGTLVIETDDPSIYITVDGENITIDGTGLGQLTLRPGSYRVQATRDGMLIHNEPVTISRGGKQVVKVTLQPSRIADVRKAQNGTQKQTSDTRATGKEVTVYAPEDGVVTEVFVDHGQHVKSEDVLLRMRNISIELELQKVEKGIEKASERVWAAEKDERRIPDEMIAAARSELANLRKDRLAKAGRMSSLTVRAPIAGQVATFEAKRTLVGRPVKAGEALLIISEFDSSSSAGNVKKKVLRYVVQEGDTLSSIAQKQLGATRRWQEIVEVNREKLSESNDLKVGMELRLPVPSDKRPLTKSGVAFSPDDELLARLGQDGEMRSWEEPQDTSKLDDELVKAAAGRIDRALHITKDCSALSHIPDWDHGDVDNITVESGGVRTLVDWQEVSSDEARRPELRFVLALYSRHTLWNPPDDTIEAYEIKADWLERTSWKTQPTYDRSPVARFKISSGPGWKLFDITSLVRAQAEQRRKGFGVMLRFADEDIQLQKPDFSTYRFVSREGEGEWLGRRPVLLVVKAN